MKVNLQVNEIVVEGLPISASDGPVLKQAMEHRLTEILSDMEEAGFRQVPRRQIELRVGAQVDAAALGRGLASGLYSDDRRPQTIIAEGSS